MSTRKTRPIGMHAAFVDPSSRRRHLRPRAACMFMLRFPVLLLAALRVAAAPFVTTPIRAGIGTDAVDPAPLGGLMLATNAPDADVPVVLVIPGSGPTDRDGNSQRPGVRPATLRLLAEGLAGLGIASVRIDKRGMFSSRNAAIDGNHVVFQGYVADTHAWMATIRARTGARCV